MCDHCGDPVVLMMEVAMTPECVAAWDEDDCREFVRTVAEAAVAARTARASLAEAMHEALGARLVGIEGEKAARL